MRKIVVYLLACAVFACLPSSPGFNARAETTGFGSTKVYVWVKFYDKKIDGLRRKRGEVVRVRPSKLEVYFWRRGGGEARQKVKAGGYFHLKNLPAGRYRFSVETPDKRFSWKPSLESQDPTKECHDCQTIEVRSGAHREEMEIDIELRAEAEDLVFNKKAPEIRIDIYRVEKAGFNKQEPSPLAPGIERQPVEVSGKVFGRGKTPLEGAQVEAYVPGQNLDEFIVLGRTLTDRNGDYFLRLHRKEGFGSYSLSVSKEAYEPQSFRLEWGEQPETVFLNLAGKSPAAASESRAGKDPLELPPLEATRRYFFSSRVMGALPVPGFRSFDNFALLAPGVLPAPQTLGGTGPGISPGLGSPGQFAVNGLRSRANNFTIDGSDNNDEDNGARRQGFVSLTPQPVETLQEFQIITALADATYGRSLGGQVNALTATGGSEFHGTLYGFYTDNHLNARDTFDQTTRGAPAAFPLRRSGDDAPLTVDGVPLAPRNPAGGESPLRRTQAGLFFGGELSRIDTFYFLSLERKVNREARESHFAVPAVSQRGLFDSGETGLFAAGGVPQSPATVPGNAVFSLYPFPNNPRGPYGPNTYTAVLPATADATLFTVKLNRRFGEQAEGRPNRRWWERVLPIPSRGDLLTGRYNRTRDKSLVPVTGGAIASSLRPRVRTQNLSLYMSRNLTPNVFDVLRFSFGRTHLILDDALSPRIAPSALLPDIPFLLNAPLLLNVTTPGSAPRYVSAASQEGAALLASLGYSGVTQTEQLTGPLGQVVIPGFSPVGVDVYHFPQLRVNNTVQAADTLRYSRGRQVFTFGGDIRWVQINSTLERNFSPLAQFNGLRNASPALPLSGPGGAALPQQFLSGTTLAAAGAPTGLFHTLAVTPDSNIGIRSTQLNFFAQDEWSPRSTLMLTLVVRYKFNTVPHTVNRKLERALDPDELQRLAREAAETCENNRCAGLVAALSSVFPSDFEVSFGPDRDDFDIRFGFGYDPGDPGKAVLRGGIGLYSGQFPATVLNQSRNAFPAFLPLNFAAFPARLLPGSQTFLSNPANPALQRSPGLNLIAPGTLNTILPTNPISLLVNSLFNTGSVSLQPTVLGLDLVQPEDNLKPPYSLQFSLIVERQLFKDYYLSASYVGTRAWKLLRVRTPDQGVNNSRVAIDSVEPAAGAAGRSIFPAVTGSQSPSQARTTSQAFAIARTLFESSATSAYDSIQLEARKRYEKRFTFGSALTYSNSRDSASDYFDNAGAFALPQNSLWLDERGPSNFDIRWRWVSNFLYDIPWDFPFVRRKQRGERGGWQLSGIITAQTGPPFTVNSAFDVNRDGNLTDRPDSIRGLITETAEGDAGFRLRLAPSVRPFDLLAPDGRDGAVGRNTFRAPGAFHFDVAAARDVNLTERYKLHLRAEFFNLFNRTHYAVPERILESPAFGRSVRTAVPARTIQLAFKLSF
jgi:hypothetical protein